MAGVGRQTDPGKQARPGDSPRLHLLVCVTCWQRPWDCACGEQSRTEDGQHVTSPAWTRLPVFTEGDVRAAIEAVTKDRDLAYQVAELLSVPDDAAERRRPPSRASERTGSRREQGRVVA